jgi:hypothetical protein
MTLDSLKLLASEIGVSGRCPERPPGLLEFSVLRYVRVAMLFTKYQQKR